MHVRKSPFRYNSICLRNPVKRPYGLIMRDVPVPIIRPWFSIQRHFYVYVKAIFRIEALVLCSGKAGNTPVQINQQPERP